MSRILSLLLLLPVGGTAHGWGGELELNLQMHNKGNISGFLISFCSKTSPLTLHAMHKLFLCIFLHSPRKRIAEFSETK